MAEMIASAVDSPAASAMAFLGMPAFESSLYPDRNLFVNPPPLNDQGLLCSIYNQPGGAAKNSGAFPKSRKRGAEGDLGINTRNMAAGLRSSVNGSKQNHLTDPPPRVGYTAAAVSGFSDVQILMLKEQQELELIMLIHMEKLRVEMEQRRRLHWRSTLQAIEERVQTITRPKDEEIERTRRRNAALEEKVKALAVEGEVWKGIAEKNEAAAMSLRRELDEALLGREEGEGDSGQVGDLLSCCDLQKEEARWSCHGCRRKEVCVLLLPCRHLCLCSDCDKELQSCPLCLSSKRASIRVLVN